jgi:hypothetical protein
MRLSRNYGSLSFLETSGPDQADTATASPSTCHAVVRIGGKHKPSGAPKLYRRKGFVIIVCGIFTKFLCLFTPDFRPAIDTVLLNVVAIRQLFHIPVFFLSKIIIT